MSHPLTELFENVEITTNVVHIDKMDELQPAGEELPPPSSVYPQMTLITVPDFKEIAGTVKIIFRDINTESRQTIFSEGQYAVKIHAYSDVTGSFYTLVKFIFRHTSHFVKENHIIDENGNLFKVPECNYSEKDFEHVIIE